MRISSVFSNDSMKLTIKWSSQTFRLQFWHGIFIAHSLWDCQLLLKRISHPRLNGNYNWNMSPRRHQPHPGTPPCILAKVRICGFRNAAAAIGCAEQEHSPESLVLLTRSGWVLAWPPHQFLPSIFIASHVRTLLHSNKLLHYNQSLMVVLWWHGRTIL